MKNRILTVSDIDKIRHIDGFPNASDKQIINLSDAPFYTAYPNPYIKEFILKNGSKYHDETDNYYREPFGADVSEGKSDQIYMAHAYHTKVPYKAIMRYILHYTSPGDIVLDGFCGAGMTGVAAQMCGIADESLKLQLKKEIGDYIEFGTRNVILNDLSPGATFISANYNSSCKMYEFKKEFEELLSQVDVELGWMYETEHVGENKLLKHTKGKINYIIWSDVFICPNCGREVIFWDEAVDLKKKKINNTFKCSICNADMSKSKCKSAVETFYDTSLGRIISMSKRVPVQINYTYEGKRYIKKPDEADLNLIKKIDETEVGYWHPIAELPIGYNTEQPKRSNGIYYVHQMYTKRNLIYLAKVFSLLKTNTQKFIFTSVLQNASKMYKYRPDGKGGIVNGTLYIPALNQENNVNNLLKNKADMIYKAGVEYKGDNCIVSTNSSTNEPIPDCSVDYIFIDPPFGANINYSELNFLLEAWLQVYTNNKTEAICNDSQGKGIVEYQELMTKCFCEFYRILKPKRWMTIEFHNSKNAVWNSIQESLQRAGFIIADIKTLNKKQGSFKQVTTDNFVKHDLIISAYKPENSINTCICGKVCSEETVWEFVRTYLSQISIITNNSDNNGIIQERQKHVLFDRMVAYHIMHGLSVPLDASEFYAGLDKRFVKHDDMYFLKE